MTPRREALLRLLADGREHSGEDLAAALDVSRAAVWKHVQMLSDFGLDVRSVPGRGYRLQRPIDLLQAERIQHDLQAIEHGAIDPLRVELELASTNTELLSAGPPVAGRMGVCIAEFQSAGRGRRGRQWIAPLGAGLCLSMSWLFRELPSQISSLALVVGVAVATALERCGAVGVELKWPNDLWIRGRKLGGILVEMRAEAGGPAFVVIGVGINVDLSAESIAALELQGAAPIDLRGACSNGVPDRSRLAVAIISECLAAVRSFELDGFAPFVDGWRHRDGLAGHAITVSHPTGTIDGLASGIDSDGALLLHTSEGLLRQVSGEVSVRHRKP